MLIKWFSISIYSSGVKVVELKLMSRFLFLLRKLTTANKM